MIYATRYLGDVGFGKYTFALSFCYLFSIFSDLGLNTVLIREIAKDKTLANNYLGAGTLIKLVLSVFTVVLIFVAVNLLNYPDDTKLAVYILGFSVVIGSLSGLYRSVFSAYERMEYEASARIIQQTVLVALGIAALHLGYGLFGLVTAVLLGSITGFVFSVLYTIKKFVTPVLQIDIAFWSNLIREALPFGMTSIIAVVYFRIDIVMLSMMKGDAVVGWYGVAYMLVESLMFLPGAFAGSLFPVFSRLFKSSDSSIKMVYERSLKYLYMTGLPIVFGTTILADKIILIVFKEEFSHSVVALQILIWALLFMFLNYGLGTVLGSINRQRVLVISSMICVIVNVVLNLLLIPPLSYIGAGIATVVTEFTLCALSFYFVSEYLYVIPIHRFIPKPLVASIIMGAYVYIFREITVFIVIPIAAGVYLGLLYLIKAIDNQDIMLFKEILLKRKTNGQGDSR